MAKKISTNNPYIPNQQDIILIDFDPSIGQEIKKRRPAVVLSSQGYSKVTVLVVVAPITHAQNNKLRDTNFLIPLNSKRIDGYINPLQFFTYDYSMRHAKYVDMLDTPAFFELQRTVSEILNLM